MTLSCPNTPVNLQIVIPKGVRTARFLQRASSPEGPCVFPMEQASYLYMMSSSSRRALYTGVTARLRSRVFEHKNDLIEGFSSKYKCHRLVYFERFESVVDAIAREKEIKGWRREKKNKLVESMNPHGRIWPQPGIRKHSCFRGSLSNHQPETQGPSLLFGR